ncbi:MAG: hypothetical protein WC476_00055 [Phycisphaerae bacterium]|jgi:hypothetical protein
MKSKCPVCGVGLNIPDAYINKTVICPKCKQSFKADLDDAENIPLKNPTSTSIKLPTIAVPHTPVVPKTTANDKSASTSTNISEQMYKLWPIVKDFFLFKIFISPWITIGTFALFTAVCMVKGLEDFIMVPTTGEEQALKFLEQIGKFFYLRKWLLYLLILLWTRVSCEWSVIIFRIHSKAEDIHKALKDKEKE